MVGGGWDRKFPIVGQLVYWMGLVFCRFGTELVIDYEQLKASNLSTNICLDETILERFENAVQALRNVLSYVHHSHSLAAI